MSFYVNVIIDEKDQNLGTRETSNFEDKQVILLRGQGGSQGDGSSKFIL
jgi:hypothetical protein